MAYGNVLVFDNKIWVLGGHQKSDAWYSEDGVHWRQQTAKAGWLPRAALSTAVLADKLWIMGGKTGLSSNSNPQDVWYLAPISLRADEQYFDVFLE